MLDAVYEDSRNLYLIMEKCAGGDLMDHVNDVLGKNLEEIRSQNSNSFLTSINEKVFRCGFPPNQGQLLIKRLLIILAEMHERLKMCHRDIKLENFAFKPRVSGKSDTAVTNLTSEEITFPNYDDLRLLDFGSATKIPRMTGMTLYENIGTPNYTAPEIKNLRYSGGKNQSAPDSSKLFDYYTEKCDLFSLGMVASSILTGWQVTKTGQINVGNKDLRNSTPLTVKEWREILVPVTASNSIFPGENFVNDLNRINSNNPGNRNGNNYDYTKNEPQGKKINFDLSKILLDDERKFLHDLLLDIQI